MSANKTIAAALHEAEMVLAESSTSPKLDAQILLCKAIGFTREKLLTSKEMIVDAGTLRQFDRLIARRRSGEPVAYLTGTRDFWKHTFMVTPAVLVPRPETEIIVEHAVEYVVQSRLQSPLIVDIGTGSGCIACSVAAELKMMGKTPRIIATDISQDALSVAIVNAQTLAVDDLIEFRRGSLYEPLEDCRGKIDLLLSNPPYVALGDPAVSRECGFEPKQALYGGVHGVELLETLIRGIADFLAPLGIALLELGAGQSKFIEEIACGQKLQCSFHKDLQGIARTAALRKAAEE